MTATTSDGSASAGAGDYQVRRRCVRGLRTRPSSSRRSPSSSSGDSLDEADETVVVTLTNPTPNARIGGGTASGTIKDNDNRSLLAVSNAEAMRALEARSRR